MNHVLVATIALISTIASANPFDGFVGNYTATSAPTIRNHQAKSCTRFGFDRLTTVTVSKAPEGAHADQTHTIGLFTPEGYSTHPIMNFEYTNELKLGGSFARTTAAADGAANIYGSWNNRQEQETLRVSIQKTTTGYALNMAEEYAVQGQVAAGCYYQVNLQR